jgi:large repetitive protein
MKRFGLLAAFAALVACMFVTPGSAASFVDYTPCPAQGPLLVCPTFQVGQTVNLQLLAFAGCDTYRWEMPNGTLPPGLSMSSSGLVTGRPTSTAKTTPWITVHDLTASEGGPSWCGGDNQSQRQFVFETQAGLDIDTQSVPGGTVNQPYSQQFTATAVTSLNPRQGSPATATWVVQSGNLPAGMSLSSSGLLSGTPTVEGSYTFVVRATGGSGTTDTETETLTVRQPLVAASTFRGPGLKGEVGIPYTGSVSASGGSGTYTFALASGQLPAGLQLGTDGAVSGTPTTAGRFTFAVKVADSEGRSTNVNAVISVNAKLAIAAPAKLKGTVGKALRFRLLTTGGVAPKAWTILRGKLPAGVAFGKKLGLFLGTPRKAGNYKLALQVVDALGAKSSKNITIAVK